jgi:hypothetical protein
MCTGTDPRWVWNDEVKRNTSFVIAFLLTLAFYFITLIRIKVKKFQQQHQQIPSLSAHVQGSARCMKKMGCFSQKSIRILVKNEPAFCILFMKLREGWTIPMHINLEKQNLAGLATIAVSLCFYCPGPNLHRPTSFMRNCSDKLDFWIVQ